MICPWCEKEMKLMSEAPYGIEQATIGNPWWECECGNTEPYEDKLPKEKS